MAWINNDNASCTWNVNTHPYPDFNRDSTEALLKLGHGWVMSCMLSFVPAPCFSASKQGNRCRKVYQPWNKCTSAGFRLFHGCVYYTTGWWQTNRQCDLPSWNQFTEANQGHGIPCTAFLEAYQRRFISDKAAANATSKHWGISQQLVDGCHGNRSLAIVNIYIADYNRLYCSVAEPSDVCL